MSSPNNSLLSNVLSQDYNDNRPASVPPTADGSTRISYILSQAVKDSCPESTPPTMMHRHSHRQCTRTVNGTGFSRTSSRDRGSGATSLDLMNVLQRSEPSVVKTRTGSVLSRGMILKTDHYPSGAYHHFHRVDFPTNLACFCL